MNVSPWGAIPPMPRLVDTYDALALVVLVLILAAAVLSERRK